MWYILNEYLHWKNELLPNAQVKGMSDLVSGSRNMFTKTVLKDSNKKQRSKCQNVQSKLTDKQTRKGYHFVDL